VTFRSARQTLVFRQSDPETGWRPTHPESSSA